jgi:hypothetical protein
MEGHKRRKRNEVHLWLVCWGKWYKHKRTGSLTVLQQAMGHASLAVSLGYLRNLEVPMLRVEDMPRLQVAVEKC